jgi:hypothetical protein
MTARPLVFEKEEVEAELRELGVPESSISPTVSFIRLVIPIAIQQIGANEIEELLDRKGKEWGLPPQSPGWRPEMAKATEAWATAILKEYVADRFDETPT